MKRPPDPSALRVALSRGSYAEALPLLKDYASSAARFVKTHPAGGAGAAEEALRTMESARRLVLAERARAAAGLRAVSRLRRYRSSSGMAVRRWQIEG